MGQGHRRRARKDARDASLDAQSEGVADVAEPSLSAVAGSSRERQLCREAREALGLALAGLSDAVWLDVELIAVEPAPDASRLAVVLALADDVDADVVTRKLERVGGYLRAELAAAIQRKRVPLLTFRLVRREEGDS